MNIQEREISSPPPSFPDAVLGGAVASFFTCLGLADKKRGESWTRTSRQKFLNIELAIRNLIKVLQ